MILIIIIIIILIINNNDNKINNNLISNKIIKIINIIIIIIIINHSGCGMWKPRSSGGRRRTRNVEKTSRKEWSWNQGVLRIRGFKKSPRWKLPTFYGKCLNESLRELVVIRIHPSPAGTPRGKIWKFHNNNNNNNNNNKNSSNINNNYIILIINNYI